MVIRTVRDYLDAIEQLAAGHASGTRETKLIFRGLSSYEYGLLPGIYRTFSIESGGEIVRAPLYGGAAEGEILHHFIKHAMSMIDHIDKDDLLTWLTYAQHFGAPTRLMDFSGNPLVSLYFSCKKEPGVDGAVCVLHEARYVKSLGLDSSPGRKKREVLNEIMRNIEDPNEPCTPYPVTFIPHYIDMRMETQQSRFIIWGSDKSAFDVIAGRHGDLLNGDEGAFFCKLRVDGESKTRLLRELSFLGVNEKRLFPGLDGIGKYVSEYYRRTKEDYGHL